MLSLDSDQQQSLLIELLQDQGGVELARCMMQRRDKNDDYTKHHKVFQSGVSVGNADQWRIVLLQDASMHHHKLCIS